MIWSWNRVEGVESFQKIPSFPRLKLAGGSPEIAQGGGSRRPTAEERRINEILGGFCSGCDDGFDGGGCFPYRGTVSPENALNHGGGD
jgi:hypothetical protein